jgi:hypothetical protein
MTARNNKGQFARAQTIDIEADVIDERYESFAQMFAEFGVLKYPIAGAIVNVVTTCLGFYAGMHVAAWIGIAAILTTGSAFLGMVIAFIGGFIAVIQALRMGAVAGSYIATGKFEDDYQSVKGWLTKRLETSKAYVEAAFAAKETSHV